MLKTTLIAAVTAITMTGGALATAAPAAAAPAGYATTHGPDHRNHWQRPGHGKPWVKRARHCEPIIRWQRVGYHKQRPVVVGWDCGHRHHRHWR